MNHALMLYTGDGIPEDKPEAEKWYRKAAEQEHAKAQFNLALMLNKGDGIPEDKPEAEKWYRRAAEQGDADAQLNLALMLYKGDGIPENKPEAEKWYRKAAEKGNANAQFILAWMLHNGDGIPVDKSAATNWFQKAAEQGHAKAKQYLDTMTCDASAMSSNKLNHQSIAEEPPEEKIDNVTDDSVPDNVESEEGWDPASATLEELQNMMTELTEIVESRLAGRLKFDLTIVSNSWTPELSSTEELISMQAELKEIIQKRMQDKPASLNDVSAVDRNENDVMNSRPKREFHDRGIPVVSGATQTDFPHHVANVSKLKGSAIDWEQVAKVRKEEEQNAEHLRSLFGTVDEDDQPQQVSEVPSRTQQHTLSAKQLAFIGTLMTKDSWERLELEALALSRGLMLDGTFEIINEAATNYSDELALEQDGDSILINKSVLEAIVNG
jgi:hypothetical protein